MNSGGLYGRSTWPVQGGSNEQLWLTSSHISPKPLSIHFDLPI